MTKKIDSAASEGPRPSASAVRLAMFTDPIALTGIALSIVVSVALDLTGAASGVESFLACQMGIAIALILDAAARAERRFHMRNMLEKTPWLAQALVPIAERTNQINRDFGGTLIATEARSRFDELLDELGELRGGRICRPSDDYRHLITATRRCRRTLDAVTNVLPRAARSPGWWRSDVGRDYWQANLKAMERGVQITRVFVYRDLTSDLQALLRTQRTAGVRVGLVHVDAIDPSLHVNLAIWDDTSAWEARMNASGEIVWNVVTYNAQDMARLRRAFRSCLMAADFNPLEEGATHDAH